MNVNDRASGPGVSLVDGIAVAIDLQRTIEMRSSLDGAFAVVLDFAAPENSLTFIVSGLQFEPDIEGVHRAAGEEMAGLANTHDNLGAGVVTAANGRIGAIDGGRDGADFTRGALRERSIGLVANGEGGRKFLLSKFA